jgi:hypothetical protein
MLKLAVLTMTHFRQAKTGDFDYKSTTHFSHPETNIVDYNTFKPC